MQYNKIDVISDVSIRYCVQSVMLMFIIIIN